MPFLQKPRYELESEYQQLALDLDVETLESESQGISPEEARLRSETALRALLATKGTETTDGEDGEPVWFKSFEMLMNGKWPWRQAAYIAWASSPHPRQPKTQDELAIRHLGLTSDRAISTWRRKNPAIDQMVAILQSAPLWEHRADAFANLVSGMRSAGSDYKFFNHLKLFLEMTGDYIPLTQLAAVLKRKSSGDESEMSEDELKDLELAAQEVEGSIKRSDFDEDGEDEVEDVGTDES